MNNQGRWAILSLACAGLLAACVSDGDSTTGPDPDIGGRGASMSASERDKCVADGGFTDRRGMLGMEMCVFPYSDAGAKCTDSEQCEGKCINRNAGTVEFGQEASGQCQADSALFGCFAEVENGRMTAALCVD